MSNIFSDLSNNLKTNRTFNNAQHTFDNLCPGDSLADRAQEYSTTQREMYADELEKIILDECENYDMSGASAFMDFMDHLNQQGNGDSANHELLKTIIAGVASDKFENRHNPLNRLVFAACRWKAEQLALEEYPRLTEQQLMQIRS